MRFALCKCKILSLIKNIYITTTIHEIKIVFCFLVVCFDLSFKIGLVSALFSVLIQSSWSYIHVCLTSRLRFIQSMKSRENPLTTILKPSLLWPIREVRLFLTCVI